MKTLNRYAISEYASSLYQEKTMKVSKIRICIVLIALVLLPAQANAFLGNIKLGGVKLPCAVACGGDRGLVNFGFLGDSVNSFITGPSIDNFADKANQAVDRGLTRFEEILRKQQADFITQLENLANEQRDAMIASLSAVTSEAIVDLDNVLKVQLKEADRILETRLGTLDVVLGESTQELASVLRRFVIFILIVGVLLYVVLVIYKRKYIEKGVVSSLWPRITAAVVMVSSLGLALYVFDYVNKKLSERELFAQLESGYKQSLAQQQFDYAIYYSSQLIYVDRFNVSYQARQEKSYLLRDMFARPALYRTVDGTRELLNRLGNAQKRFIEAHQVADKDLNIMYGFALWQRGDDRVSEYIAANIMAQELQRKITSKEDTSTLTPLAYFYLAAYLSDPIPDDLVKDVFRQELSIPAEKVFGAVGGAEGDGENLVLKQRMTIEELAAIRDSYSVDIDGLARANALYAYVRVSLEAVKTYRTVVSNYGELIRLTGELKTSPDPAAVRLEIKAVGKTIVDAWTAYLNMLSNTSYADQTAKLNNFRGLWPIYNRALGATRIGDQDMAITAAAESEGIHEIWLRDIVQPAVRNSAFRVIKATTLSDFRMIDAKLEAASVSANALYDAIAAWQPLKGQTSPEATTATSNVINAGLALSRAAAEVGLFGCVGQGLKNVGCTSDRPMSFPLGNLLFSQATQLDEKSIASQEAIKLILARRSIPAF